MIFHNIKEAFHSLSVFYNISNAAHSRDTHDQDCDDRKGHQKPLDQVCGAGGKESADRCIDNDNCRAGDHACLVIEPEY